MKAANTPVAPPRAPEISCPPLGEFIYCGGGSATYQVVLDWQPSSDPSVIRDYLVVLENKDTSANWQFTVGETQVDVTTTVQCADINNYRW